MSGNLLDKVRSEPVTQSCDAFDNPTLQPFENAICEYDENGNLISIEIFEVE